MRFSDPDRERAFLEDYENVLDRRQHTLLWSFACLVVFAMELADPALHAPPECITVFHEVRYGLTLPTCAAVAAFGLFPKRLFQRYWQVVVPIGGGVMFSQVALVMALVAHAGMTLEARTIQYAAGIIVLGVMVMQGVLLRFVPATLATVVPSLLWLACIAALRVPADAFQSGAFLVVAANALAMIASHRTERLRRLEFEQRHALAIERAKAERLLHDEVRHQVAERSRELGDALARVDAPAVAPALAPGDPFESRYRIVGVLGAGGMGVVYEVERMTDARRLALKVISGEVSGPQAARFAREAEIGARLHHRNLVAIVDVGVSRGSPFLVMELVQGGSLEDQRSRFGNVEWALAILRQVAAGLGALHDAKIVHRDLKPGNVLLDGDVAKIADFGISRLGEPLSVDIDPSAQTVQSTPNRPLTGTGALLGTPRYMAPEAARGGRTMGAPADVFAFGLVAYELLTGKLPFTMPPVLSALAGQSIPEPEPIANVPPEIDRAIRSCLATDPEKRPALARLTL